MALPIGRNIHIDQGVASLTPLFQCNLRSLLLILFNGRLAITITTSHTQPIALTRPIPSHITSPQTYPDPSTSSPNYPHACSMHACMHEAHHSLPRPPTSVSSSYDKVLCLTICIHVLMLQPHPSCLIRIISWRVASHITSSHPCPCPLAQPIAGEGAWKKPSSSSLLAV